MKKNTKKKLKDIRSAIVMMCVMVAMMSTASYAWFSLTDSPTVTGMRMTAASASGGLEVSNEASANFHAAINITGGTTPKTLKPVTPDTTKKGAFKEGVYTGNKVTGLSPVSNVENYVAKYTYYLKSTAATSTTDTIDIGFIMGDATQNKTTTMIVDEVSWSPSIAGSMVRKASDANGTATEEAAYAVRVGFVVEELNGNPPKPLTDKMLIWDPNTDNDIAPENPSNLHFAQNACGVPDNLGDIEDFETNMNGTFVNGGTDLTSKKMFSMLKGSTAKVEMYIWLEGTDTLCVDEIQTDDIEAQIQFTVVGETTTPGDGD